MHDCIQVKNLKREQRVMSIGYVDKIHGVDLGDRFCSGQFCQITWNDYAFDTARGVGLKSAEEACKMLRNRTVLCRPINALYLKGKVTCCTIT